MKPGKVRSLIFFVLLFAVAALALEASYAQGRDSDAELEAQGRLMNFPVFGERMVMQSAHEVGIGEMLRQP